MHKQVVLKLLFYGYHLLSSSNVLANSFFVWANSSFVSFNSSLSSSFSPLQIALMHFGGGRCCFGCFPPKCGCLGGWTDFSWEGSEIGHTPRISETTSSSCWGSEVGHAPRISETTSSSCWALIFFLSSLAVFGASVVPPLALADFLHCIYNVC